MNIKNRVIKLEKKKEVRQPMNNGLTLREIDYRAGLVPEVKEPSDAIPLKIIEMIDKAEAQDEHKE